MHNQLRPICPKNTAPEFGMDTLLLVVNSPMKTLSRMAMEKVEDRHIDKEPTGPTVSSLHRCVNQNPWKWVSGSVGSKTVPYSEIVNCA